MWHVWESGKVYTDFWWGHMKERDHLEDLGLDVRVILNMGLPDLGWGGMDLIDLVQDRDRWRALVNAVMNLGVP
jgi:hypothetical protein